MLASPSGQASFIEQKPAKSFYWPAVRRIRTPMASADRIFLHVLGLLMASLASHYYQIILSHSICSPLGASMVLYSSFNCVATWFQKKRALAMGITASGSSLGCLAMPILVDHIINRIGSSWAMRTCAFFIVALLAVTNLTVRSRLRPNPNDIFQKF